VEWKTYLQDLIRTIPGAPKNFLYTEIFGLPRVLKLGTLVGDCLFPLQRLTISKWISWFLSSKGNEYFCEVDEDFILDRFNLTGLNNEVSNYSQALDLITDNLGEFRAYSLTLRLSPMCFEDDEVQEELRCSLDVQARLLYGLIHARWIVTARGLAKMVMS
jgi:hypothetical protein